MAGCGRRGGKSFILAVIAVFLACFRDWRPHLAPGERATVMVIAADRRQARVILRYIQALVRGVPNGMNVSGEGRNRLIVTMDGPEAHALGRPDLPVRVRFTDFYRRGFSGLYNPGEVAVITAGEAAVLVANGRAELAL